MTRILSLIVVALAALGCAGAAAPDRSSAATAVGIGEQDPSMFRDDLFERLGVTRARYVAPWNVAFKRRDRKLLDAWLDAAGRVGVEPLVSFSAATGSRCPLPPCTLPSVRSFTSAFRAFRRRWPLVRVVSPWNEANHRSQPTFNAPRRAAELYNVVLRYCRRCKIIAADVLDDPNMVPWLNTFRQFARRPRIWGLHNYRDTNPRPGQLLGGTRLLLQTVPGEVWLTETGGIVKFVLPNNSTLFPYSESAANSATKRMFALAKRYRGRIKRLYIYHWRQPARSNRFDAGLVRRNGRPRPAYFTVRRNLRTRYFKP